MSKKIEKIEKKIDAKDIKKAETKKTSSFKKKKKIKKKYYFWNCLCLFNF